MIMPKIKTILLLPALISLITGLTAFTQKSTPSIVGVWTQFEVLVVNTHGSTSADTAIKYDRQYTVTFTADSQYRYTGPRVHPGPGSYNVSGDMLHEVSPSAHYSAWLKIVSLTDHKLVLQSHEQGIESPDAIVTTTTYKR
jgi:hypothetical protein